MVHITGDIHGEVRRITEMIEKYEITPSDIIVILGDVGMNYYGNKKGDRHRKKKLNNHGIPILCIHGNHEMRPESLITYREDQWHGGTVYAANFDTIYRLLCDDTHQSPYVLGQHIKNAENGILIDAGFQLENFRQTLALLISIVILPIPKLLGIIPCEDNIANKHEMIEKSYINNFRDLLDA